ncbi:hypothetical protein PSN45_000854 [Yamadazyma tenuis]|uniref:Kinetochore-associated protein n=1 Tax=Candida tenuis (strain ATCC 10573 / BCRC 21748 / CBS 615 / JCM 9827 / NBRC 10315 / NRRL Y-1498 / VKM Y-70) TaxID=590646 RepID=G3BB39_CANTC|nr:kinetochore-associated protein Nnf1p [Yamadazyma tenuis ATCC 10573]EGV62134.1 kinetochore-associated protein Nnf1p [Yamadazyma tenuis ATCC 10573]WEJ93391.1 hypothetical protein PSN45_000854 [Yamadazyma tenuis]
MDTFDKIRYERLRLVCTRALEESIKKSLDIESIKKCYPTVAGTSQGESVLESARSQIIDFWFNNSIREFDLIFQERDLHNKLDSLDEIIHSAKVRGINGENAIEIDKLTPREIIEANKSHKRNETVQSLRLIYNQLCIDNLQYFKELSALVTESNELKAQIYDNASTLNQELQVLKDDTTSERVNELLELVGDDI